MGGVGGGGGGTLTAEKDGWGDLVYNPLHEIEKVETDTLYQFPDDTSNLPDYFIESLEGDEIVADFEGSTLRFDIPEGQRTIAFATLSHQNKPGSLTFNGGDTGNLQVRYSTIDRGGVRMFWLSAKESALNIEANNVWLQFDVSNGTEEVMFEGAGSVSIDANNDVVLYANQLDNSKMKSLIQANAGASYDINGKNVYFLAQGESSNRGGAKPGFSGIVFAGNDLKIGSDKTEKIVFEGFDHALIIHGGENSSSVGYTVSHAEAQEIHLLGKNTSKSTGLTLDGIQDFYLKSNLLHIEGFEQSIEAKNNGFAFINTNNLNLKGNINSDTDSVISITTNSAQIQGDIVAKNAATFELKAESNVNFVGSTHSIKGSEDDKWVTLNLDLGKDSQWTLTADSDLDSLSLNNSVVDLSLLKKQTSLTIKKEFSGSENTFILWSNLMNQEVSQLEINNAEDDIRDAMHAKMGMLFQGGALFDSLSVWENVAFGLIENQKWNRKDAKNEAIRVLRQVGLAPDVADLSPSELSGGMQKRVSLARAIATKPEIIFFDEPTTGLDPIMADVINDLIIESARGLGATALTITHDMASARKIADRIAMLYKGKIIWCGTVKEMEKTDNPYVCQFINGCSQGPIKVEV